MMRLFGHRRPLRGLAPSAVVRRRPLVSPGALWTSKREAATAEREGPVHVVEEFDTLWDIALK